MFRAKKIYFLTIFMTIFGFFAILSKMPFASENLHFNHNPKNYNVKLKIFDKNKKIAEFFVAIADNDDKRNYGLMNLEHLDQQKGMLFIFKNEKIVNMWMKNTRIPLDMVFIDKNNVICHIFHNATPFLENIISSERNVDKVLEINGGLSDKMGIKLGQKIIYENF